MRESKRERERERERKKERERNKEREKKYGSESIISIHHVKDDRKKEQNHLLVYYHTKSV